MYDLVKNLILLFVVSIEQLWRYYYFRFLVYFKLIKFEKYRHKETEVNKVDFLTQFFRNRAEIVSVTPSSPSLINKLIRPVDFSQVNLAVEFGPGDGCGTKEIMFRLKKDARLLAFETNEILYNYLKSTVNDPRFTIVQRSAEYVGEEVQALGFKIAL